MPCYDEVRDEIEALPGDDACYAPQELPLCEGPYPMETIGGGDSHEPFMGLYDESTSVTLVDPAKEGPYWQERYPHGIAGFDDLPEVVDLAVHQAGEGCINLLKVVDKAIDGKAEFGDQQIGPEELDDPAVHESLARLSDKMCEDGKVELDMDYLAHYDFMKKRLLRGLAAGIDRPVTAPVRENWNVYGFSHDAVTCLPPGEDGIQPCGYTTVNGSSRRY